MWGTIPSPRIRLAMFPSARAQSAMGKWCALLCFDAMLLCCYYTSLLYYRISDETVMQAGAQMPGRGREQVGGVPWLWNSFCDTEGGEDVV